MLVDAGPCSAPGSTGHRTPGTAAVPGSPRHHPVSWVMSFVTSGGEVDFHDITAASITYSFVIGVSLLMFQWVNVALHNMRGNQYLIRKVFILYY